MTSRTAPKRTRESPEMGLGHNPLADDVIVSHSDALTQHFYVSAEPDEKPEKLTRRRQPLKDGRTWRLVTFSFYEDDVTHLDELLVEAKRGGLKRVSRSQIVRLALRSIDMTRID